MWMLGKVVFKLCVFIVDRKLNDGLLDKLLYFEGQII